jgi:hypothetical protein
MSKGNFEINSCNMTHPRADNCVGAIEAKFGSMEMRFTLITDSSAHAHHGAMCVRLLDQLTIEFCLFANISHCTDEYEAAAVLLCYENAYDSAIVNSAFLWNRPNASYCVNVLGGHVLHIEGCCFTGTAEAELAPRLVRLVRSQFAAEVCPDVPLRSVAGERMIGFIGQVNQTKTDTEVVVLQTSQKEVFEPLVDFKGQKRTKIVICVAVATGVAVVLTALQVILRNAFNEAGKDAKAIL